MKNKILLTVGIILLCYSAAINPTEAIVTSVSELNDVSSNDPNYEGIRSLVERWGIIDSYNDGTFKPNAPLTHADFAVLLNSALNQVSLLFSLPKETITTGNSRFKKLADIKPTDYYYQAIVSLDQKYGILISNGKGEFAPNDAITQAQLHSALDGLLHYKDTPTGNTTVTRGAFCTQLSNALDNVLENVAE